MDQGNVERSGRDPATVAREIIDANRYMTLATADAGGRPWASPVWYAHQGYTDLYWVSRPEARHSRNLAVRPEVGIVIFDSTVPEGDGQAVYVEALAEELIRSSMAELMALAFGALGALRPRGARTLAHTATAARIAGGGS